MSNNNNNNRCPVHKNLSLIDGHCIACASPDANVTSYNKEDVAKHIIEVQRELNNIGNSDLTKNNVIYRRAELTRKLECLREFTVYGQTFVDNY